MAETRHRTPAQELATLMLGEDVREWAGALRADDRGWQWIANKLRDKTDGRVRVSRETIRVWVASTSTGVNA